MKATFYTNEFMNSHAREPKGHGYWGFDVSLCVAERGTTSLGQYWATGTYSAAKREAKKRAEQDARSIGGTGKQLVVRVLP